MEELVRSLQQENLRLKRENSELRSKNQLLSAHNSEIYEHLGDLLRVRQEDLGSVIRVQIESSDDLEPLFEGLGYIQQLGLYKAAKGVGNQDILQFLESKGIYQ